MARTALVGNMIVGLKLEKLEKLDGGHTTDGSDSLVLSPHASQIVSVSRTSGSRHHYHHCTSPPVPQSQVHQGLSCSVLFSSRDERTSTQTGGGNFGRRADPCFFSLFDTEGRG